MISHTKKNSIKRSIALIIFLSLSLVSVSEKIDTSWKLKREEDGIKIFVRQSKNSNLKEIKSVTKYKTSLSSLVQLILDKENYPEWVYACSKSYNLKKVNDIESYSYQKIKAPWPVSNRDMIIHNIIYQDSLTGVVIISSIGVPNYIPQNNEIVRIPQFKAYWKFTPLGNNEIEIEYFMSLDPGGDIPDWLINMAITEGPLSTIKNMKTMLSKNKSKNNLKFIKDY